MTSLQERGRIPMTTAPFVAAIAHRYAVITSEIAWSHKMGRYHPGVEQRVLTALGNAIVQISENDLEDWRLPIEAVTHDVLHRAWKLIRSDQAVRQEAALGWFTFETVQEVALNAISWWGACPPQVSEWTECPPFGQHGFRVVVAPGPRASSTSLLEALAFRKAELAAPPAKDAKKWEARWAKLGLQFLDLIQDFVFEEMRARGHTGRIVVSDITTDVIEEAWKRCRETPGQQQRVQTKEVFARKHFVRVAKEAFLAWDAALGDTAELRERQRRAELVAAGFDLSYADAMERALARIPTKSSGE